MDGVATCIVLLFFCYFTFLILDLSTDIACNMIFLIFYNLI
jgi:hypothetical protein